MFTTGGGFGGFSSASPATGAGGAASGSTIGNIGGGGTSTGFGSSVGNIGTSSSNIFGPSSSSSSTTSQPFNISTSQQQGGGRGQFSLTTSTPSAAANLSIQDIDKHYTELPPPVKAEIDRTYVEFKAPMDTILYEISRQDAPHHLHEVAKAQKQLKLQAKYLKIKQVRFSKTSRNLREISRSHLFACRRFGHGGLEQIQKREVYDMPLNESLPTEFYRQLLSEFEDKMATYTNQIQVVDKDFQIMLRVIQRGEAGGDEAIGKDRIMQVVRNQQEVIDRLVSSIQAIHTEMEYLRNRYVDVKGVSLAIFSEEERMEKLRQRKQEQMLREAIAMQRGPVPTTTSQQQQQQTSFLGGAPTTTAPTSSVSGGIGGGFSSTGGGAGGGFGTPSFGSFASPTPPTTAIGAFSTNIAQQPQQSSFGMPSTTGSMPPSSSSSNNPWGALTLTSAGAASATPSNLGATSLGGFGNMLSSTTAAPSFGSLPGMPQQSSSSDSIVQAKMKKKQGSSSRRF